MKKTSFLAALSCAALLSAAALAEDLVVHAGQLLDRPGKAPRGASTVVVRDGRIHAVEDGFRTPAELGLGSAPVVDLRERFVLLAHGKGRWESPEESWRVADALGAKGVPNRVDEWGTEWDHDWPTWRRMMPQYLGELLDRRAGELAVAPLAQVAVPAASPAPAEPAAKPARKPTARKKPAK